MRSILLTTAQSSLINHSCVLGGPWMEEKASRTTSHLSQQRCIPLPRYNHPGSQAASANDPLLTSLESCAALGQDAKAQQ